MTRNEAKDRVVEAARKVRATMPPSGEPLQEWINDWQDLKSAIALYDSTPDSEGGWRKIETAPKDDETVIDVWQVVSQRNEALYAMRKPDALWFRDAWTSDDTGELLEWEAEGEDGQRAVITHWQPRPAPPSQEQKP